MRVYNEGYRAVFRIPLFVALGVGLLNSPVCAHDWYPVTCCGGNDCLPLADGAAEPVRGGFLVRETGETIPWSDAKPSPDGRYHRCRTVQKDPISLTRRGCFWAPFPGS